MPEMTKAEIEQIVDARFAAYSKSIERQATVSSLDPLTVSLATGPAYVTLTDPSLVVAVGDKVHIDWIGTGYAITGLLGAPVAPVEGEPQPPAPHTHTESQITDLHTHPTPAMELIATYVGDASASTWKFGGGGNAMAADIPDTYSHLWLRGRLSHNDASSSLQGASLRFNGVSTNSYRYLEDRTVGTGSGSGATETNTFNPDDAGAAGNRTRVVVGTGGGIDLFIPDYHGASGFTVYQIHYWAIRGTGSASFTGRRFSGRFDGAPITSIECSLGSTGGSDQWQTTTRLSLYGMQ